MATATNNQTTTGGISDRIVFLVLGSLLTLAIITSLIAFFGFGRWWVFGNPNFAPWLDGFFQNAGTEFLGALLTFYLIETLLRKRRAEDERRDRAALQARLDEDEERRTEELKALQREVAEETRELLTGFLRQQQADLDERERRRLINQTTSTVPGFAAEAVRLLKHHDEQLTNEERSAGQQWYSPEVIVEAVKAVGDLSKVNLRGEHLEGADLYLAKLEGVDLKEAKLAGANLERANLTGARLEWANLEGAWLQHANLQGAILFAANLEGAKLGRANLEKATLRNANLQGAYLRDANLEGADLRWANLEGADLIDANLEGADLKEANLEGAKLWGANLAGALFLTLDQLRSAETLQGTTLPDSHRLPNDDTWQQAFDDWSANTAQLKNVVGEERIVPTRTEANAEKWDKYFGE